MAPSQDQPSNSQSQPQQPPPQQDPLESIPATELLHKAAIGVAILGPIAILLPGKTRFKFNLQNSILGTGTFWAYNQLAHDYTGKSIVTRSNERWAAILSVGGGLPTQAEKNKQLMAAEKERLRRIKEGLPPLGLEKEKQQAEEKRGVLTKVWMGDEKEGWKEKRLEEERKALESGKGYSDLIVEQIWDVWNQTWRGGKKEEKHDENANKPEQSKDGGKDDKK
ncbi:hypothetical protein V8F20_002012 [Naviculisporaceae sp. PSN 640]